MSVRAGINNFNSGKWSPLLASRTDLDKRVAALKESVNFMSLPHGPIQTMPGSKYVDYANSTEKLIPFIKDRVDNYMIKLTLGATAFYKDQAKLDVSEWDIATAVYASKNKDVSAEVSFISDVFFSSDGTKMYVLDGTNDTVYQYTLSTAWDVSTASYASKNKDVSSQEGVPRGFFFSIDGTKMYIVGSNNDTVYQYTLSTAWDVSTATYSGKSKSINAQDNQPVSLFFSNDGVKMYALGATNDTVYQYTLSTLWDVSTATYDSKSKSVASEESSPLSLFFSSDGTKMYVSGNASVEVHQYTLSTAWDVSTASYSNKSKDVSGEESVPQGIFLDTDGTKMYVGGNGNVVYQYTVGYASNPYSNTGDLDDITYAQTGNELYLFHPKYPIKKITYYSDSVWALSDVVFDPPPLYLDYVDVVSAATATITLSATSGKYVTITPSDSGYRTLHSGDIGRGVSDGTGYGIIRAFSNQPTTLYVMEVIVPFRTTVYDHTNNQIWLIGSPFGEVEILGASVEIGLSCVLSVSSDNQKAFELQGSAADVWTESATAGVYYLDNGSDEYARLPAGPVAPNNVGAKWMYFNKQGSLDRTTMERFEWGWGDDDTLGYDTIYIRIDGDADPDTLGSWELFAEIDHDKDVFTSADVGRYMVIHSGYIKIDTVNSAAEARGTISVKPSSQAATYTWTIRESLVNQSADGTTEENPSFGFFYQDRLGMAGFPGREKLLVMSRPSEHDNFATGANDADAISYELNMGQSDYIIWAFPRKDLLVGTTGGEYRIGDGVTAITPTNLPGLTSLQTTFGSESVMPIAINNSVFFVEKGGKRIRELNYDFNKDSYSSPDVTLFAEDLTERWSYLADYPNNGDISIVQLAYWKSPLPTLLALLNDGQIAALTYAPQYDLMSWYKIRIAVTDDQLSWNYIKSMAAIQGDDYNELWVIVDRSETGDLVDVIADGSLEVFQGQQIRPDDDILYGDAAAVATQRKLYSRLSATVTYNGAATTTPSGFDAFANSQTQVAVIADGEYVGLKTVTQSGSDWIVTLDAEASVVHAGGLNAAFAEIMPLDARTQKGSNQEQLRATRKLRARFYNSRGGHIGTDYRTYLDTAATDKVAPIPDASAYFTGDRVMELPSEYASDDGIVILADEPYPMTLLAVSAEVETR